MTRICASSMISILAAVLASGCSIYFGEDPAPPVSEPGGGATGTGGSAGGATDDDPGGATDQPGGQCAVVPDGEVILDCAEDAGYQVDSWEAGAVRATGLHLVSVYESAQGDFQQHVQGEAHVEFRLPGSHVLALSAYEPTRWVVDVAPGARLDRIVVLGYHEQVVDAPAAVPVEIHDTTTGSDLAYCGYSLPYNGGGCDTEVLIADVEALTGLELSSFNGCYRASEFVLASAGNGECRD